MNDCGTSAGHDAESVEAWCLEFIEARALERKLLPKRRPEAFSPESVASVPSLRSIAPGRAVGLVITDRAEKVPRPGALREVSARIKLLHLFLHHEIQAAELSAWALLRFPETPLAFRRGLLGVLDDEARHARMYAQRIDELGGAYGDHPVRDWFWERSRTCEDALQYVALMGLGFEGANLEHAERFEAHLREAGDDRSADLVAQVGREEVAHVRFAARWFTEWTGGDPDIGPDFDAWAAALPAPLTPAVLRGRPLALERRSRAGLSPAFVARLAECGAAKGPSPRS